MISTDPRCYPLIELSQRQIHGMLQPVLGDVEIRECARVEGGLVNTIYRIKTASRGGIYALRIYAADSPAFKMEYNLLSHLAKTLPVPRVLFADSSGQCCQHPYLVYQWLEGINLNECRRQSSPEAFLTLAEPLGRVLAQIAGAAFPSDCVSQKIQITTQLERAEEQLRTGLARARLCDVLADALRNRLSKSLSVLNALDEASVLVHGDFGGRNVLVKFNESGNWEISGVIDWEEAATGSAWWDLGSLFRYPRRYSEEFRTLFVNGYDAAGGKLPTDWWLLARTVDAMRLLEILSEERELPIVFAECVELVQSIVVDLNRVA